MTQYAEINGVRIVSGVVTIPYYGTWTADLSLVSDEPIPTDALGCTVTLGGLTLRGTAYRTAPFTSSRRARLVGGAGGWRRTLPKRAYYAAGGIPLSMILGDAATEAGETVAIEADAIVGDHLTRPSAPGGRLLRERVSLWWIDPTGVTRIASARPSAAIASDFQVIEWDTGRGWARIATESNQDWMPGNTFLAPTMSAPQTIAQTMFRIEAQGTVRVEVLTVGAVAA